MSSRDSDDAGSRSGPSPVPEGALPESDLGSRPPTPEGSRPNSTGDQGDGHDGRSSPKTDDLFPQWADENAPKSGPKPGLVVHQEDGYSYSTIDIITIHGLRDDYNTAWIKGNGTRWAYNLFVGHNTKEINYSYEVDEESEIYHVDGIRKHAQRLLTQYAELQNEDELEHAVVWVCHDIGGHIMKEALSLAISEPKKYGRVAALTTGILFFGTPHRAWSDEDLEEQLLQLMLLPGPPIKRGLPKKARDLARQVNEANQAFLDTKVADKAAIFNIIPHKMPEIEPGDPMEADTRSLVQEAAAHDAKRNPLGPDVPFPRYNQGIGHSFEGFGRVRFEQNGLLELVEGKHENEDMSWTVFNVAGCSLTISDDALHFQIQLMALSPPTRALRESYDPLQPQNPVATWALKHDAFPGFDNSPATSVLLHIHGNGNPAVPIAELSRYIYIYHDADAIDFGIPTWDETRFAASSTVYFEFDRRDSRYSSLASMLLYFINALAWRFWRGDDSAFCEPSTVTGATTLFWEMKFLQDTRSWSLEDLYHLFRCLRDSNPTTYRLTFFISCFDQCPKSERDWFLEQTLDAQSYSENGYHVILSSSGPDILSADFQAHVKSINIEDFPAFNELFSSTAIDAQLEASLNDLVEKRPVYDDLRPQISNLLGQCHEAPHLGRYILNWLEHYEPGAPRAWLAEFIPRFDPVTAQNIINVFISSLSTEAQSWAKDVFHWVKYSAEPWTLGSLAEALAVRKFRGEPSFNELQAEELRRNIETAFGGMIIVEGQDIKFSHSSFYELVDFDVQDGQENKAAEVNGQIAETCLLYLGLKESQQKLAALSPENLNVGPELETLPNTTTISYERRSMTAYAARFWPIHYRASGVFRPTKLVRDFFAQENRQARGPWEVAYYTMSNPFTRVQRSYVSLLPTLSMLGLDDLVAEEMENSSNHPFFEKDCWLAITEAVRSDNEDLVRSLLGAVLADGTELRVDEKELSTAIFWAAARGKSRNMDILLERIPDLATFQWPSHIMDRAAGAGLENVLLALHRSGRDINELGDYWGGAPAITTAVWRNQVSAVEYLLQSGLEPNLRVGDDDHTPMINAAQIGNPRVVDALVKARTAAEATLMEKTGADEEWSGNEGWTSMRVAVMHGKPLALKRFLDAGVALGEVGVYHRSLDVWKPLLVTVVNLGMTECTRVLLENGVDPNETCDSGSALWCATKGGHVDIVRMLLDKDRFKEVADPNICPEFEESVMTKAVNTRSTELVDLLVKAGGAQVNSLDMNAPYVKTPLAICSRKGDLDMVKKLISLGADVNYTGDSTDSTDSPLFSAIYWEQKHVAEHLLSEGADVGFITSEGWNMAHACYRMPDMILTILQRNVNPNLQSLIGSLPMIAARWGYPDTLAVLLKHGVIARQAPQNQEPTGQRFTADVDVEYGDPNYHTLQDTEYLDPADFGYTALLFACRSGEPRCVKMLLDAGANPAYRSQCGTSALRLIALNGNSRAHEDCLTHLLSDPTRLDPKHVDDQGNTVLHLIDVDTLPSIVRRLVRAGVPIDFANDDAYTPLAIALRERNVDVARWLIEEGAQVNLYGPQFGSVLHLACATGSVELVRLLVEAGADPSDAPGKHGESLLYTALDIAAERDRARMVRYLVDQVHVNVNATGGRFMYPIIRAADQCGSPDDDSIGILRFLIRRGADINAVDDQGRTPAHLAAKSLWDAGLATLVDAGAAVDVKDAFGRLPLHIAASCRWEDCIDYLLRKFPDMAVDVPDNDGWTPLLWAARSSRIRTVELLIERGADVWTRGHGLNQEWSALKLANLADSDSDIKDKLVPAEKTRRRSDGETEEWDKFFHNSQPGHNKGVACWSCFVEIIGYQWKCIECNHDVSLCFKCFRYGHGGPGHASEDSLEEIGPNFVEVVVEPSIKGDDE